MDFISIISFSNEPLISCTFFDHFCHHFWVDLLLHPHKWPRNIQLIRGSFEKEIGTSYKIGTLDKSAGIITMRVLFEVGFFLNSTEVTKHLSNPKSLFVWIVCVRISIYVSIGSNDIK